MNFLKDKKIFFADKFLEDYNGLKLFVEKQDYDGIAYNCSLDIDLKILNLYCYGNMNFYEYQFRRDCDIIDNVSINIDQIIPKIIIDYYEFDMDEIKEFLFVSAIYSPFSIRILFDKNIKLPDTINIIYRKFLINNKNRALFLKNNIYVDNILYKNGYVFYNKEFKI